MNGDLITIAIKFEWTLFNYEIKRLSTLWPQNDAITMKMEE